MKLLRAFPALLCAAHLVGCGTQMETPAEQPQPAPQRLGVTNQNGVVLSSVNFSLITYAAFINGSDPHWLLKGRLNYWVGNRPHSAEPVSLKFYTSGNKAANRTCLEVVQGVNNGTYNGLRITDGGINTNALTGHVISCSGANFAP